MDSELCRPPGPAQSQREQVVLRPVVGPATIKCYPWSMIVIEVPQFTLFHLFDSKSIAQGMTYEAPGGVRLELEKMPMEKRGGLTLDALPMATVLVSVGKGVATVALSVFSRWLYDKLKSDKVLQQTGTTKIRMNRVAVEITPEEITRVLTESIEIEHKVDLEK